jgi:hypothetical protein
VYHHGTAKASARRSSGRIDPRWIDAVSRSVRRCGQADILRPRSPQQRGSDSFVQADPALAMKANVAFKLLAIVALLTPMAAMLGLYDTSFDQVARFVAPIAGAAFAIGLMRFLSRRRTDRN